MPGPEIDFIEDFGLCVVAIQKHQFTGGSATNKTGKSEKGEAKEAKPGKKIEVDEFIITGAKVHLSLTGMGGTAVPIPLPEIRLADLGKDADGITAAELTKKVMQAVLAGTTKAAAGAVADLGKGAADAAVGAGKTATESVGKAAKGIGGLFKKKE